MYKLTISQNADYVHALYLNLAYTNIVWVIPMVRVAPQNNK